MILFSAGRVFATEAHWEWKYKFNAHISKIAYHDGFIYTSGIFSDSAFIFGNTNISNKGGRDVVIMKWDTSGNLIWANSIWGLQDESVVSLHVNANNELIIGGNSNSMNLNFSGNIFPLNGGMDFFISKYDLNGGFLQSRIFGTLGNDTLNSVCTDFQNNIYLASNGGVAKFDPLLVSMMWQRSVFPQDLFYSKHDSTLILAGPFKDTLSMGNFTIVSSIDVGWQYYPPDIFAAKLSLNNSPIWLRNVSNHPKPKHSLKIHLDEQTERLLIAFNYHGIAGCSLRLDYVNPDGTHGTGFYMNYGNLGEPICYSLSSRDSVLSISIMRSLGQSDSNYFRGLFSFQYLGSYANVGREANWGPDGSQHFRSKNEIYTLGNNNISFGKIDGVLFGGIPEYQTLFKCQGQFTTLAGNISGGVGPLSYSWSPVTGLNNTNTNSVSFIAQNNIIYTLTVTEIVLVKLRTILLILSLIRL